MKIDVFSTMLLIYRWFSLLTGLLFCVAVCMEPEDAVEKYFGIFC